MYKLCNMYMYMYIYIYVYIHVCIYIYIYIYSPGRERMERCRDRMPLKP